MSAIFDRYGASVDEYVAHFGLVDRQRGAIFAVRGGMTGLELFDRADSCRRLMPKLIRSYAIDAMEVPPDAADAGALQYAAWLEVVATAPGRVFAAVGEGATVRLEGESLVGAAWSSETVSCTWRRSPPTKRVGRIVDPKRAGASWRRSS
jgi:hypothetical protein